MKETKIYAGPDKAALVFGQCKECGQSIDCCTCPSAREARSQYLKLQLPRLYIATILSALRTVKCDLTNEPATHESIAAALTSAGIEFEREVRIDSHSRLDFLCAKAIAVEVKLDGSKKDIYRQVNRYAESELVHGIIVASARAIVLPAELNGKPVAVFSLSKAWL